LTVNAGSGNDHINVGYLYNTVANISALLTVNGELDADTLNVDNTAVSTAKTGNLTSIQLTGLGMSSGISYGGLEALVIGLGSGVDAFSIASTQFGTTTNLNTNGGADNVTVLTTSSVTTVNTGDGNDTINIQAISAALSVNAGNNDDTINVGSLVHTVANISALLTVDGESGADTLNVANTGVSTAKTGNLTSTQLTGLGMASGIGISYGGLEALVIGLGSGDDTFTIASTYAGATILNTNGGVDTVNVLTTAGVTTVNTGDGNDTINIQAISAALSVNAGNNNDTINVGSLVHTVANISALLTVDGESGVDTLNLDNIGDSTANLGTLTSTQLTGLGMASGISYGSLEALVIGLGSGDDTFTIASTLLGTTNLNTNGGADKVTVLTTSSVTTVNTGAGNDTINVGDLVQKVNSIRALLSVNGGLGTDTLNVVNNADSTANTGTMTSTQLTGLGMASGINYGGLEALLIGLGSGADTFSIASTQLGTTTNLNTGAGNDTINVGDLVKKVNSIGGLLTINGESGADTLNVANTGDSTAETGNLTSTQLTGLGMASGIGISYGGLEALVIGLGSGVDTFSIASTQFGTTTNLNTNGGADKVTVLTTSSVTTVNTGDGNDTITVGDLVQKVNSISALLSVNGGLGTDTLNVVNTGDSTVNTGNLTSTQITGLGMASGISYGSLEALVIGLGSGDDTFSIASTQLGTTTNLNTNGGADKVTVLTTSSVTTVNTGAGNDTINVGDLVQKVNSIRALLSVNGQGGNVSLFVNARGDASNSIGNLTSAQITGLGMASGINYSGLTTLEIDLNLNASKFTVASTKVGTTTTISKR
jgi:hypothetical protein